MVRLMLTLTPVVCVCGGIVVSEILTTYLDLRTPSWTKGEDPSTVVNEVMSSSRKRQPSNTPQETTGNWLVNSTNSRCIPSCLKVICCFDIQRLSRFIRQTFDLCHVNCLFFA